MFAHPHFVASVDAAVCLVLAYPLDISHHLFLRTECEANCRIHSSRNALRPVYDALAVSVHNAQ